VWDDLEAGTEKRCAEEGAAKPRTPTSAVRLAVPPLGEISPLALNAPWSLADG
jgi:hypothetical protein